MLPALLAEGFTWPAGYVVPVLGGSRALAVPVVGGVSTVAVEVRVWPTISIVTAVDVILDASLRDGGVPALVSGLPVEELSEYILASEGYEDTVEFSVATDPETVE